MVTSRVREGHPRSTLPLMAETTIEPDWDWQVRFYEVPDGELLGRPVFHRPLPLGVVVFTDTFLVLSPETEKLVAMRRFTAALIAVDARFAAVVRPEVAIKMEVSARDLASARERFGRDFARTVPASVPATLESVEAEIRALVTAVIAYPDDLELLRSSAIRLSALRAAVAARREQVDRMDGYLDSARVLLRGELPL